jgi:DNA-directed RNA polymerase subunit beta
MLTIKSDDVHGRAKAFEAMVKGTPIPAPKVPESFRVLVRELNSLGLDIIAQELEEVIDEDAIPVKLPQDELDLMEPDVLLADDSSSSGAAVGDDDDDDDTTDDTDDTEEDEDGTEAEADLDPESDLEADEAEGPEAEFVADGKEGV